MAKLQDKFYNRVIEGELELDPSEIEDGASNGIKVFEDIKDKDGHSRFIEGDIIFHEREGITKLYGKWSLAGSHLMIVICPEFANGTTTNVVELCEFEIPQWIYDKLVPIFLSRIRYQRAVYFFDDSAGDQFTYSYLLKKSNNKLGIYIGNLTFTSTKRGTIEYDLLIDND